MELGGVITGRMPGGRVPAMAARRSPTCCRAARTSVRQENSTYTTAKPWLDWLRTACTPGAPRMAVSSGWVTSDSTSSGDRPGHSVSSTTRGRSRSGNTSIGSTVARYPPSAVAINATNSTSPRCLREKRMTWFSIAPPRTSPNGSPCGHCHPHGCGTLWGPRQPGPSPCGSTVPRRSGRQKSPGPRCHRWL